MQKILIDTNILIYFLNKDPYWLKVLWKYKDAAVFISIISWIEVLAGSFKHIKTMKEVKKDLEVFEIISLGKLIGEKAAYFFEKKLKERKMVKFQDGIIAATALVEKLPLLTNNPKDFYKFKGLKHLTNRKGMLE